MRTIIVDNIQLYGEIIYNSHFALTHNKSKSKAFGYHANMVTYPALIHLACKMCAYVFVVCDDSKYNHVTNLHINVFINIQNYA